MNKPIGHYKMLGMVVDETTSPHGTLKNKRKCNCRVCGLDLPMGLGFRWLYFYIDSQGRDRATHFFLCDMCNSYWMTYFGYREDLDLINQYLIRFNIKRIVSEGTNFIVDVEIKNG